MSHLLTCSHYLCTQLYVTFEVFTILFNILFKVFTILQFIFYFGWLHVAEVTLLTIFRSRFSLMRLFFMSFKLVWVLSLSAPDFNTLYVFRPRRWSQFEYFVTGVIINTMHVPGADQPFWRGRWRLWPQLHHWQERNTLFIVTFKNIAKLPWHS